MTSSAGTSSPTIVLVHGAWADASSWTKVIRQLLEIGHAVRAVQIPLTGLADDVAAVRRMLADIDGSVVLVGHSWGGTVITEAGDDPKVMALVYVAAFVNEAAQSGGELLAGYAPLGVMDAIRPDGQGFLLVTEPGMTDIIAHDLPAQDARVLVAVQRPLAQSVFDDKVASTAWSSRPSWYVVAAGDRAFTPAIQRDLAGKIAATTSEVEASHMLILSKPGSVVEVIRNAIAAVYPS